MTILGYHHFQNWHVLKEQSDNLDYDFTFGFELEVTYRNTNDRDVCEELANILSSTFNDYFVYERDGSIGNGVEIISQPMTWNWFMNHLGVFEHLLMICDERGFSSHDGNMCGLHVHIGRNATCNLDRNNRELDEHKVITNINYILERFQDEIYKFSRRTPKTNKKWCSARTELIEQDNGCDFIDKNEIKSIDDYADFRYRSLNLSNSETIEFRFLRGTLNWKTFFISMNLIKNIVEYGRMSNHSITFNDLVFNGLNDEEWIEIAKAYCAKRKISLLKCAKQTLFLENTSCDKLENIFEIDKLELANSILNN